MIEKWSEDLTIKFLKKYKKKQCLWNVHYPQYRNQQIRNIAYQELVDEMQLGPSFTVERAKNKIKNLRSTYTQELKKMEQSNGVYITSLVWFDQINSFLRPLIGVRTSNQHQNSMQENTEISTYHLWNNPMTMNSTSVNQQQTLQPTQTICLPEPLFVTVETHDEIVEVDPMIESNDQDEEMRWQIENIRSERKTSVNGDENSQDFTDGNDDESNDNEEEEDDKKLPKLPKLRRICDGSIEYDGSTNNNNIKIPEDEFDAFGRSVALQLKSMSLSSALNAQIKIQTVLTELRLADFDNNSDVSNSETTSH